MSIKDVFRLRRPDIVDKLRGLVPLGDPWPDAPELYALNRVNVPPNPLSAKSIECCAKVASGINPSRLNGQNCPILANVLPIKPAVDFSPNLRFSGRPMKNLIVENPGLLTRPPADALSLDPVLLDINPRS